MTLKKSKIFSIKELSLLLENEKKKNIKIVLCHGVFDLLHSGHILHLKTAKQQGEKLVVSVTPDRYVQKGPDRPYFSEILRMQNISELECVDYVVLNEWPTAIETIFQIKPHIYVKGHDYSNSYDDITGNIDKEKAAIEEIGGKIVFTNEPSLSSSHLLNEFFPSYSKEAQNYLKDFKKKYSLAQIYRYLDQLRNLKVLVIGEAICDRYVYCLPLGKSIKESIIAGKYLKEENFLGGTLAIANHVSNFCKEVTLITTLGKELDIQEFVFQKLNNNIKTYSVPVPNRSTILKTRFVDQNNLRKIFEIQYLDDTPIPTESESAFSKYITAMASMHDLIIIADYGHGFFTEKMVAQITELTRFLCINAQTNTANFGFNLITKYKRANYICIDEPEMKFAVQNKHLKAPEMVNLLKEKTAYNNIMISLGADGTILFKEGCPPEKTPVFSSTVVDRTGAGDTVFSITSPLIFMDCPAAVIGLIANCAGALAVKTLCNREQLSIAPLKKFMAALLA